MNHETIKIAETRRIILPRGAANKRPRELRTVTAVQASIIPIYATSLHFSNDHAVTQHLKLALPSN